MRWNIIGANHVTISLHINEARGISETYGAAVHLIAKCERHDKQGDACGIRYGDLLPRDSSPPRGAGC
jgi:hypothetical protein